MPTTNGQSALARKRIEQVDSPCEEARRLDDLQTSLLQIGKEAGLPLSYLKNPRAWYKAGIDPEEYEPLRPYLREQDMLRDLVATVGRIGTAEQRDRVRRAIDRYFDARKADALEMIGMESEADTVKLTLLTEKEIGEARCATITALTSGTPESLDVAVRENREAATVTEELAESIRRSAQMKRDAIAALPLRWLGA